MGTKELKKRVNVEVITFGAPRVGDSSLATCMHRCQEDHLIQRFQRLCLAGDRAPKFPFNRTDYVHVGEEIILREGSNLKGSRGLMPISAHLIQSYVNAIDESKRKYAAEHKMECDLEEKTENTNDKNEGNSEENTVDNTEEMTEEKAEMIPETVETND